MSASKKSGGKRFLFLGRATQSRHYILTLAWKRLWLGFTFLHCWKGKEVAQEGFILIIAGSWAVSCYNPRSSSGLYYFVYCWRGQRGIDNINNPRSTRSPQNKRNKSGLLDSSWRLLTASWQAARSQILILNENIAISKPFQTNNIYTYRLGDEERTPIQERALSREYPHKDCRLKPFPAPGESLKWRVNNSQPEDVSLS